MLEEYQTYHSQVSHHGHCCSVILESRDGMRIWVGKEDEDGKEGWCRRKTKTTVTQVHMHKKETKTQGRVKACKAAGCFER